MSLCRAGTDASISLSHSCGEDFTDDVLKTVVEGGTGRQTERKAITLNSQGNPTGY